MKLPTLVRLSKPKTFGYTPRYYDEIKEDIEFRRRRIARELNLDKENEPINKEDIRHQFRQSIQRSKNNKSINLTGILLFVSFITTAIGYYYLGDKGLIIGLGLVIVVLYAKIRGLIR